MTTKIYGASDDLVEFEGDQITAQRDSKGKFLKGFHYSPETEFKKGQCGRSHKKHWDKDFLIKEYITKKKTLKQIASENNCNQNNIWYFIKKHKDK